MAKSKKSKILAMALCASVMTGIYASPVMAEELYVDGTQSVTTKGVGTTKIASLEGLKEITLGDSVKITTTDGGIIRVGNAGGVNARVFKDGFYVNTSGDDRKTSLKAGTLTLAGIDLTSEQLDIINDVITNDGAVVDVTSKAGAGKTYSLNTVGKNTSGIRRAVTTDENRSTYIEETVQVNNNGGLAVLDKERNVVARVDRSGNVLTEGVGRFGALKGPNVRMENGVLTVNSTGETYVAKLNAEGLTLTSDTAKATLSAEQIARLNTVVTQNGEGIVVTADHFKNTHNSFAVYSDGAVRAADGKFKVGADGDVRAANGKFNVGADGAVRAANGKFNVGADGDVRAANGKFNVGADGDVRAANGKFKVDADGAVRAATVNGVAIGMNGDGDITLGNGIIIDNKFNSGNVAGITREPLKDSALGNTTYIEQNTAISADGIVVTDPGSGVSTKTKYDGFYVKDKDRNIVSSLEDDGLRLTDAQSGMQTLKATDIADIKGIDREGAGDPGNGTTTIEGATSFTKDGMVTSNITTDNITTDSFTAGVTVDSSYGINEDGEMLFRSGDNYIGMDRGRIGFTSGTESVTINGEGTTFTSRDSTTRTTTSTVIKGGTITTDTLKVENIVLGSSMTDEVGNSIALGADGTLKVNNENYSLNLNESGFNLNNGTGADAARLVLKADGFTFKGSLNLGAASDVKFGYTGNLGGYTESSYSLSQLVDTVNDIYDRTSGIYKDDEGNTVVTDGTWNAESKEMEDANSSITVGTGGATFESTTNEGATNINGGAIYANSSSVGNDVSGGSGSGSSGSGSSGTYTDGSVHTGYFEDGDNSYEFTNDADGFTGTVTDGKHTTTIENGAMGSNTTVTDDGDTSASSGVGIGNDGAFISDSVTNGDMTVTEVKDKNGSATTVKDANGSSTVSQDTQGQTVSTGTGTSVNTGNDFGVTDNETGKSIYMSDIGHVEDIDSEIQNSDGSKTTVVDAVNNEAEIRRNEIERVDGRINNLENRVGKLEDRIDKVGAMAAAIANLRTMGYDPAAPTEVAVGIGQYRDETGAALGLFHYPNRDFMLSLSVSTSGDEVMGGIGATWKFGRKSPEKVAEIKKAQAEADARRAEEAKLAKAEEMKQAAKEAKIKAQQERHAKLAAQAEAAK